MVLLRIGLPTKGIEAFSRCRLDNDGFKGYLYMNVTEDDIFIEQ